MNIALWMLAGGLLGWASHAFLRLNIERGAMVSVVLGAAGALLGGKFIAPMFIAAALPDAMPGAFSGAALLFAAAMAATVLVIGNLISNRFNV